jgi:hypothetical protein
MLATTSILSATRELMLSQRQKRTFEGDALAPMSARRRSLPKLYQDKCSRASKSGALGPRNCRAVPQSPGEVALCE